MVHDLSPFLIRFSGDFGIRWYGLSYILGFVAAYYLMVWLVRRQNAGMNSQLVGDLIFYVAMGTLIGGRLGYCLFYSPDLFVKFKPTFPFWGVLAVNEGGMASHGGMMGIVVACILFARKHGINTLYLLDLCVVSGSIGVMMGRIANFINGELVGRPADPSFPLAVKFPSDIYMWPSAESQRLPDLATVVEKMGVTQDQWLAWVQNFRVDGAAREQMYATLTKIISEIQGGNTAVKEAIAPFLTPRHPSQLYGAFSEGLLVFLVLFFLWRKPRKPGFIGCSFLILYGIVRISDEYFRMPDAHIGYQLFDLTRGQWLSIVMVAIGMILMFVWMRSGSLTINGWGRMKSIKFGRK